MYIKNNSYSQLRKVNLDFDGYIPLAMKIGNEERVAFYLRYVSEKNLLELGISKMGELISIDLVTANSFHENEIFISPCIEKKGFPFFNVEAWRGGQLIDINFEIEVTLAKNSIFIKMNNNMDKDEVCNNYNIDLAKSFDGSLSWILLKNITIEQKNAFKNSIKNNSHIKFMP